MIRMYQYIASMYGLLTYLQQKNMDQPGKVAKPGRGKLNREIKCSCTCIRGKYVLLLAFVYIAQVYFLFQGSTRRAAEQGYATTAVLGALAIELSHVSMLLHDID